VKRARAVLALCALARAAGVEAQPRPAPPLASDGPARTAGFEFHTQVIGGSPTTHPARPFPSGPEDRAELTGPNVTPSIRGPLGSPRPVGTAGSSADRAASLRAVVRLRARGELVCTGTVVALANGATGIVTAAHCLFSIDASGHLRGRRTELAADGVAPLDVSAAVLGSSFAACADSHRLYRDCVAERVQDVAFIPVPREALGAIAPWGLCQGDKPAQPQITIFGYGLNGRQLPRLLLQGAFTVTGDLSAASLQRAIGVEGTQISFGDSGGPAVTAREDALLDSRLPCVRYVSAAVQVGDPYDPAATTVGALLQPVWQADIFQRARAPLQH
jgi:hypothetical protein